MRSKTRWKENVPWMSGSSPMCDINHVRIMNCKPDNTFSAIDKVDHTSSCHIFGIYHCMSHMGARGICWVHVNPTAVNFWLQSPLASQCINWTNQHRMFLAFSLNDFELAITVGGKIRYRPPNAPQPKRKLRSHPSRIRQQ